MVPRVLTVRLVRKPTRIRVGRVKLAHPGPATAGK
jgi:hypothetical protein